MTNFEEKRAHSRVNQKIRIGLQESSLSLETETKNISASGISCRIKQNIPLMTRLKMKLELPFFDTSKMLKCGGVVVRCQEMKEKSGNIYDVAIFIDDISDEHKELLADFICGQ